MQYMYMQCTRMMSCMREVILYMYVILVWSLICAKSTLRAVNLYRIIHSLLVHQILLSTVCNLHVCSSLLSLCWAISTIMYMYVGNKRKKKSNSHIVIAGIKTGWPCTEYIEPWITKLMWTVLSELRTVESGCMSNTRKWFWTWITDSWRWMFKAKREGGMAEVEIYCGSCIFNTCTMWQ